MCRLSVTEVYNLDLHDFSTNHHATKTLSKHAKLDIANVQDLISYQAIKNQEIPSIHKAARRFDVSRSTLRDRLKGRQFSVETSVNNYKLTATEEETLTERILRKDLRGNPRRVKMVREIATRSACNRPITYQGTNICQ